ncbi:hypothetical protein PsYK624_104780 [Phanerochaete sordida]|uniref:Uncharacterized protein n=1 Tax=Phanerochaete sordida TaxID=48140 RepID=A0A9P3GIP7_9APHY|nr:hypothetical protein PsYK624_104780 [Phanerochaete sordida]
MIVVDRYHPRGRAQCYTAAGSASSCDERVKFKHDNQHADRQTRNAEAYKYRSTRSHIIGDVADIVARSSARHAKRSLSAPLERSVTLLCICALIVRTLIIAQHAAVIDASAIGMWSRRGSPHLEGLAPARLLPRLASQLAATATMRSIYRGCCTSAILGSDTQNSRTLKTDRKDTFSTLRHTGIPGSALADGISYGKVATTFVRDRTQHVDQCRQRAAAPEECASAKGGKTCVQGRGEGRYVQ